MATHVSYLGLSLPHPFVAGASPFGYHLDTVKRLEDVGCAAVVLHSLFEEQITATLEGRIHHMNVADARFAHAVAEFPPDTLYAHGPDEYAEHVSALKRAVRLPIIASLNGTSPEAWLRFARVIEQAGADALELNLYEVITSLDASGASIERELTDIVRAVKRTVSLPVAVKVSPFFTAFASVARQLDDAGADALVMFNRFYQPDIDITTMQAQPQLQLSTNAELPLRLRWLAIVYGRVRCGLAASGGISSPNDGIKAILAGAHVVQLVSTLLRHGPAYIDTMRQGLARWMEWHELATVEDMRGRTSLGTTADAAAFERANYIRTLQSWIRP
jgi:dihydroorotate dehydrogenase (fumarate)